MTERIVTTDHSSPASRRAQLSASAGEAPIDVTLRKLRQIRATAIAQCTLDFEENFGTLLPRDQQQLFYLIVDLADEAIRGAERLVAPVPIEDASHG